jgi:hypothetical protein
VPEKKITRVKITAGCLTYTFNMLSCQKGTFRLTMLSQQVEWAPNAAIIQMQVGRKSRM